MTIPTRFAPGVRCRIGELVTVPVTLVATAGGECSVSVELEDDALLAHPASTSVSTPDSEPTIATFELLATRATSNPLLVTIRGRAGGLMQAAAFTVEVLP